MARLRPFGPPVPWALRLLLLAALLLGVVTMHTLGHPGGGHGGSAGQSEHSGQSGASGHGGQSGHGGREGAGMQAPVLPHPSGAVHHGPAAEPAPVHLAPVHPAADHLAPVHRAASAVGTVGTHDPAAPGGMDPMAVCLAVLAGWTLVLLLAGPLLRRSGDAAAEVRARLLRALRALPPPGGGRILLTRLSVLRQ
ncbi:hypothetical protein ACFWJ4_30530 [Kitasatospora sp. NPDC127067]|uniref:hypothetical protein n=1 Tax=Kitasatospora sp. NPDC127067 TaxID=3347126 RepID=UPI0036475978